MKIYLAAGYASQETLQTVAARLEAMGHKVVSRWLYVDAERMDDAEGASIMDLVDIVRCDLLIYFCQTKSCGGHVEFGYAMARGKQLAIVGRPENVFHYSKGVKHFSFVGAMYKELRQ